MKNKTIILGIISLFLLVSSGFAQTVDKFEMEQLKALSKLKKFGVYVWEFEGDKWNTKLNEAIIEKFVKTQLKHAGIKTVSFSDARGIKGTPTMEVSIRVDEKGKSGYYAYSVILRFIQDAILQRTNRIFYGAITWERDDVGFSTKDDLDLEIKISLNALIDEFIADYRKVN